MEYSYRAKYIGDRIKALRKAKGITQQELADKCDKDISRTTIQAYESSDNMFPSIRNLYAIADALEVPIDEFFLKEDAKSTCIASRYEKEIPSVSSTFVDLQKEEEEAVDTTIIQMTEEEVSYKSSDEKQEGIANRYE